eukprot:2410404-Amphidinium_carterae.1
MGAKIVMAKGSSKDSDLKDLIVSGISEDMASQAVNYYAWVPSASNPADWPTRGESGKLEKMGASRVHATHPK